MRAYKRTGVTCLSVILVIFASMLVMSCSSASPTPATTSATTAQVTSKPATTATPTVTADKYGGILKVALNSGLVGTLGYLPELGNAAGVSMKAVFDRLLIMKMDGSIEPELATSWKVADDRKSITLGLRKGVKFHDGSEFNSEVCKWNLDLQIQAKKSDVKDWTSIDVIDPNTIRINLSNYTNTLYSALSKLTISGMMSKAAFDKNGIDWVKANPTGTGPFVFVSYQPDAKLTFKKNPNYWDTGKPYIDGIEMSVILDDSVRKVAFERNDIVEYAPTVPSIAMELEKSEKYNLILRTTGPRVLAPDSMNPKSPWADIRVRMAASYALDRDLLAKALGSGHSTPPYQLMQSQKDVVISDLVPTKYDPDKAKQLLTEAGYASGFKTTLTGRPLIITQDQVSAVASMLRKVGIDVTVETVTAAKYDSMRIGGTWEGLLAESMLVQQNKNDTFISYFTGKQWSYVKKPDAFRPALDASLSTLQIDTSAIKKVIQVLYDDMTVIPFYEEDSATFQNKGYRHDYEQIGYNQADAPRYSHIWLEKNLR